MPVLPVSVGECRLNRAAIALRIYAHLAILQLLIELALLEANAPLAGVIAPARAILENRMGLRLSGFLFQGSTRLLARRDRTEVGTLSGGVMFPQSDPLQTGIRFFRLPLPARLSPPLTGRFPSRLRAWEAYGLTVLHRCDTNGLGSTCPPATLHDSASLM